MRLHKTIEQKRWKKDVKKVIVLRLQSKLEFNMCSLYVIHSVITYVTKQIPFCYSIAHFFDRSVLVIKVSTLPWCLFSSISLYSLFSSISLHSLFSSISISLCCIPNKLKRMNCGAKKRIFLIFSSVLGKNTKYFEVQHIPHD